MEELTPRDIVRELDRYIIGQAAAKRAVAIALRNRRRRQMVQGRLSREIRPTNILMIGPTGVGKTEIARRVAKLLNAPFTRVEATKFTQVGYVGRDVDSIVHDLVETAVNEVHDRRLAEVENAAADVARERILDYLCQQVETEPRLPVPDGEARPSPMPSVQSSVAIVRGAGGTAASAAVSEPSVAKLGPARPRTASAGQRRHLAQLLADNQLEDTLIEIELSNDAEGYDAYWGFSTDMSSDELTESFNDFVQSYSPTSRKRRRRVSVRDARRLLTREESFKLVDIDLVVEEALEKVETAGVVFIDELDKVTGTEARSGPDVSGEGVQRDLLPIVEGSTVMTRYGPVKTDHILFIAAGAFYQSRPSDLIPELQGRFPLRVELDALSQEDLERILTEPDNSLLKQYGALLATEGVELEFTPDGIAEIAAIARLVNRRTENIGARRLSTILERALEDVSFEAPERQGERVIVDRELVRSRLSDVVEDEDLSRYIV